VEALAQFGVLLGARGRLVGEATAGVESTCMDDNCALETSVVRGPVTLKDAVGDDQPLTFAADCAAPVESGVDPRNSSRPSAGAVVY
jgi:hypothetical protein